jgi:hypothetical protein
MRMVDLLKEAGELSVAYPTSLVQGLRNRRLFASVERFCFFLGYPRSGHSIFGALMDAHPEVVIAQELDALRYVEAGFGRLQLFQLILANSQGFPDGRKKYPVKGQYQGGRFTTLRVIGDKKGGGSALRIRRDPALVQKVRRVVGVPLAIVHIVRNPYDNISTIASRNKVPLERAADIYFEMCDAVASVRAVADAREWHEIRHEEFVADPVATLRGLAAFVGVSAPEDWLAACKVIVHERPNKSRHGAPWTPGLIAQVGARAGAFAFLQTFSFDK